MDELKGRLKGLLSKGKGKDKGSSGFSGQGHRLGTAEPGAQHPPARAAPPHGRAAAARGGGGGSSSAAAARAPAPPQQEQLRPATEFSPFTACVGSGAALSAHGPSQEAVAAPAPAAAPPEAPSTSAQPCVSAAAATELAAQLALVAAQPAPAAAGAMRVLDKLLANLAAAPGEARFRQLRLANPTIAGALVPVPGGLGFLAAAGFEVHHHDLGAQGGGGDDGFAAFLDDSALPRVHEALAQLRRARPAALAAEREQAAPAEQERRPAQAREGAQLAPGGAAPAGAAAAAAAAEAVPAAPRVERDTQVLLPATPDTEVPDWFFERTGAEVKAEFMDALRRRKAGEVFASRAWQAARRAGGPPPTAATLRARFPEGVCLQGIFHVREPLSSVHDWLRASLREPGAPYELVGPDRRPLGTAGSVGDAGLAPASLLNWRPLGQQRPAGAAVPALRDELLARARAD
ncbi:PUX2 [Scenedesmus sp. PABB004]|nr:PUX2 [Scenedesmus sp. PABB004]